MKDKYSVVSLFSGAGGMDLGFKMEGNFKILLANDILSPPAFTYAENFGHRVIDVGEFNQNAESSYSVYLLGDAAEIDFSRINNEVDVVIGGPPCQDFSIVRGNEKERLGIKVKRGRLYAHFIRALIHLQPKVFVFENVPGLKSANKGTAYKTILEDFSQLKLRWEEIKEIAGNSAPSRIEGYFVIFSGIVDSADLGVPQRRKRLIIIGVRNDLVSRSWLKINAVKQKVQSLLSGENSIFKKYPLTAVEVFEGRPIPELQNEYKKVMEEYKETAEIVKTKKAEKWKREVWEKLTFDIIKDYLFVNNIKESSIKELDSAFHQHAELLKELGYYGKPLEEREFPDRSNAVSKEIKSVLDRLKMIPPDENHEFVKGTEWEVEGRGISLIYRRLHPLKPSYTVVAYGGGGTWGYHYRRSRGKLTNRERARLQTFPDFFMFKGSSAEVRAQIGEAVPPLLGKKIAQIVTLILTELE
ncbi:MAG TPA: DNA cytosine methyltransferase [Candidatus Desulfofervidus auxilii]|uniref:Cytosine-specific methyltransferase n=1 Tax=Desulfofervidus auxilii TaxID=1621989 RepID=A0A7C0Y781_DESA2|nr:DNA cytosine methyltransferase [Candidatus Desulfofervidus auxilii]